MNLAYFLFCALCGVRIACISLTIFFIRDLALVVTLGRLERTARRALFTFSLRIC